MRDELGNNTLDGARSRGSKEDTFWFTDSSTNIRAIYFDCKNYLWEVKICRMNFQKYLRYVKNSQDCNTSSSSSPLQILVKRLYYPSLLSLFFLASIFLRDSRYNVKSYRRERGRSHSRRMARFNSVVSRLETKLKQKRGDERNSRGIIEEYRSFF